MPSYFLKPSVPDISPSCGASGHDLLLSSNCPTLVGPFLEFLSGFKISPLTSDHLELIYNLMTCLALSGYRSFVPTLIHASGPFGLQDTYSSVCCLIITWQLEMERGKKKGIGTFIKDHLWAVILLGSLCGLPHSILIIPL